LLPTQNVTGVVELSTNTVRMSVLDGIGYAGRRRWTAETLREFEDFVGHTDFNARARKHGLA
jgi:hypothetical protein